jgi:hypothetical protein
MLSFNITFSLLGPSGRIVEAPNTNNPVKANSLRELLTELAGKLDMQLGIQVVGVKVEQVFPES